MPSSHWWTWANLLTAVRLLVVIPSAIAILSSQWMVASLLFAISVITDVMDGHLARRLKQMSALGGLFDHATDALYVTVSCWALAEAGLINPFLCWAIPAAFIQYALDSKALAGHELRTSAIGRANGVAYFIVVGTGVGANALNIGFLLQPLAWLAWALVATTALSMLERAVTLLRLPRDRVR